jgi:transcriptional regulator with XRE-family HTH domain
MSVDRYLAPPTRLDARTYPALARRLQAARRNAGLTQKQVAVALGITVQWVSATETSWGSNVPSVELVNRLLRLYGID